MSKKTKPLIIGTGLSGLLGSRIVELLESKFKFVDFSLSTGIDITNLTDLEKNFIKYPEAKLVLHLAAFTDVSKAWRQRENKQGLCYRVNVYGTENIAKLCQKYKKYLVHISTDFVFDGKKKRIYYEYDQPRPIEWYGMTKYLAEKEVINAGCRYCILRTAFPFKAKKSPKRLEPIVKLDLVRRIIKKLKNNQEITLFSDQIITPTFIDDIAKTLVKIYKKRPKGIFHLVGSSSLSPYDLGLRIADILNLPKDKIIEGKLTAYLKKKNFRPRQHYLALSNAKLKNRLRIFPLGIRESLLKMKPQLSRQI